MACHYTGPAYASMNDINKCDDDYMRDCYIASGFRIHGDGYKCSDCGSLVPNLRSKIDPRMKKNHANGCSLAKDVVALKESARSEFFTQHDFHSSSAGTSKLDGFSFDNIKNGGIELKKFPTGLQRVEMYRVIMALGSLTCRMSVEKEKVESFGTCFVSTTTTNEMKFEVKVGHLVCKDTQVRSIKLSLENINIDILDIHHSICEGTENVILVCKSPSKEFTKWLEQAKQELSESLEQLPEVMKKRLEKSVVLISHPYGKSKFVTFGTSQLTSFVIQDIENDGQTIRSIKPHDSRPRKEMDVTNRVLLYTADASDGSSGAPVLTFQKQGSPDGPRYEPKIWIHCGVSKKHDLPCSTMEYSHRGDQPGGGWRAVMAASGASGGATGSSVQGNGAKDSSTVAQKGAPKEGRASSEHNSVANTLQKSNDRAQPSKRGAPPRGSDCHQAGGEGKQQTSQPVSSASSQPSRNDNRANTDNQNNQQASANSNKAKAAGTDPYRRNDRPPHRPYFADSRQRELSFDRCTTKLAKTPKEYAAAGFFCSENCKVVECFYCSVTFDLSESMEDVFEKHRKLNLSCAYLNIQLSPDRVRKRKEGPNKLNNAISLRPQDGVSPTLVESSANLVPTGATSALMKEKQLLERQSVCKMCDEVNATEVFLPCGHLFACALCNSVLSVCPKCDQQVLATVTLYWT